MVTWSETKYQAILQMKLINSMWCLLVQPCTHSHMPGGMNSNLVSSVTAYTFGKVTAYIWHVMIWHYCEIFPQSMLLTHRKEAVQILIRKDWQWARWVISGYKAGDTVVSEGTWGSVLSSCWGIRGDQSHHGAGKPHVQVCSFISFPVSWFICE